MSKPFNKSPISISYSGWKRYKECPQKHFLVMTGQRPSIVNERNFLNGQVLHKVLERWFSNDEDYDWIRRAAPSVWDEYVAKRYILFKSDDDRGSLKQTCLDWGASLSEMLSHLQLDKAACQSELEVERFISVDGHPVRLHGFIDVLAPLSGNQPAVLDLKCSRSKSVMDFYQIVFYSLLLEDDLSGTDRFGAFILPAFNEVISHCVAKQHRDYLMRDIQDMVRLIVADGFNPRPETANCFWCEVRHVCPAMGNMPTKTGRVIL